MTRSELRRLLSMIATPDTDPACFDFVFKRLVGVIHGVESDQRSSIEKIEEIESW